MTTSYTNFGGSGARAGIFLFTTDFTFAGDSINRLCDGDTTTANGNIARIPASVAVAGKSLLTCTLQGLPRVIDKIRLYLEVTGKTGGQTFKVQAYDGSTWIDLSSSFALIGSSGSPQEVTFTNSTAYQAYRILGISGTSEARYFYEIEFSTLNNDPRENGDRRSAITMTDPVAMPVIQGGVQTPKAKGLIDGAKAANTTDAIYFQTSTAVGGAVIFDMLTACIVKNAFVPCSGLSAMGTWTWEGSNDGSTWTTVKANFTWTSGTESASAANDGRGWHAFSNSTAYRYYRFKAVSGTVSSTPYVMEVMFDIDAAGPPAPGYGTGQPVLVIMQ